MPRQTGIRLRSAAALVVANMIGVGIFTTTGFQAELIDSPLTIYALWIVGGLVALCGALCYSELGAAMPAAGGEYVYLREAYGGSFGFMSALVSLTAGFSAPIAAALKGFAAYLTRFLPQLEGEAALAGGLTLNDGIAISLVWMLVAVHSRHLRAGIGVNDWLTVVKVAGIVLIIVATAAFGKGELAGIWQASTSVPAEQARNGFSAFGTSLIFVMFCYSGLERRRVSGGGDRGRRSATCRSRCWPAPCWSPASDLCLNVVYFYGAPIDELAGQVEVGLIAARGLFGPVGITLTVAVLLVSLLASASAMTIAGPRVYYAAGRDAPALRWLARRRAGDSVPTAALLLQGVVTTLIILAGTVDRDPAVRRVHPHFVRHPGHRQRVRAKAPAAGAAPSLPGLGLSPAAADFHGGLVLDDVLGVSGAPGGVAAGTGHSGDGRAAAPVLDRGVGRVNVTRR
ncbi:MAG: APC family permease [Halioglobus sp.]|nr:APC family permease [Halioglobus sp.]